MEVLGKKMIKLLFISGLLFLFALPCYSQKPFKGSFILIDSTKSFVITYDTLTSEDGCFLRVYKDTLNLIDKNGYKQGLWIEYSINCFTMDVETGIIYHEKIESYSYPKCFQISFYGNFKNNKKDGLWEAYFMNGGKWKNVNYRNGKINGDFYFYYENGKLKMYGKHISRDEFEISRYNEQGTLLSKRTQKSSEIIF